MLYQVTTTIEAVYSPPVTAASSAGATPQLDDRPPMLVIEPGGPVAIQPEVMGAWKPCCRREGGAERPQLNQGCAGCSRVAILLGGDGLLFRRRGFLPRFTSLRPAAGY